MGRAAKRKRNRKIAERKANISGKSVNQQKYSKEDIESRYSGLIKEWVNHGSGEVAIMKDKSEVFLAKQEILNWKGWHPLNQENIEEHIVLIKNKLAGKYKDVDLATLLEEAGYEVIYK